MLRVGISALLLAVVPLRAEERTFAVTIDGKPAGDMVLNFKSHAEGRMTVSVRAEYRIGGSTPYAFDYRGTESSKNGRVVRLEGLGSENGHKGSITLTGGKDAYALKAGVKEVSIRDEVWPATGVLPPSPERKPLVVDVISGDVLHAKTEKIGAERVEVGEKTFAATHYRVTAGASRWDVWYDENNRLVKRVWMRDGRTIVAQLTDVKSD